MSEEFSRDQVSVEFFVKYLDRVVPPKIDLPADFHEHARSWAQRIMRTDSNPLDIARDELVELWDLMRPSRDEPGAIRDDQAFAALLISLVQSDPVNEAEIRAEHSNLAQQEDKEQRRDAPSVNLSKYQVALRECEAIPLPSFPAYRGRIDLKQIQEDAAISIAAQWDEQRALKPYARRVLMNAFWSALRPMRQEARFIQTRLDENPARQGAQTGTKMREWEACRDRESSPIGWMIGRGQWKDEHAFLAFWISQTKLDFVKVLSYVWCQLDPAKNWPYREQQFAIPLSTCVKLLDVSSALKRLLDEKAATPVSETGLGPAGKWLQGQLYQDCIWNDFASQKVTEQFNDWTKVVPKNARSIVRATWDEIVEILRDSQEGIISKLCYFLTVGVKRGVGEFVGRHIGSTIQDLALELGIIFASRYGSHLRLARFRGSWEPSASYDMDDMVADGEAIYVATGPSISRRPGSDSSSWKHIFVPAGFSWITKELARARFNGQKIWNLTLSTIFQIGVGLTGELHRKKLEGDLKKRVNRIDRQVQVNILRRRGYSLNDNLEDWDGASY